MPSSDIEVEERFGSRRDNGGTIEYLYWARGTIDEEDDVKQAVFDEAPADHDGVVKGGITEWEQQGNDLWFATVSYPSGAQSFGPAEASQSFEFTTAGGTEHVEYADHQVGTGIDPLAEDGGVAPEVHGAIQVEDAEVKGIDIGVKVLDFSITRKIPIADFDSSYLQTIYDLSWKYNKTVPLPITFIDGVTITFPAGTILYKGAAGGGQEGERISITFFFSFSPNLVRTFHASGSGDGIEVDKLGHQYLWIMWGKDVADTGGKQFLVPKPVAAYVGDVYDEGDLTALGVS